MNVLLSLFYFNKSYNCYAAERTIKKTHYALSHITCVSKLSSFYSSKSKGSVVAQLSSAHKEQIRKNRLYVSHLIDIVLFLGKQGVAFRVHYENDESINQGIFYIL